MTDISTLPANLDAERAILGAILLESAAFNEAAETLRADDFSLDSHRRIYARMAELSERNEPIDIVTLTDELGKHRDLEAIGGAAYISSLLDGVPDRPSIEHYCKIVKDKATLRRLVIVSETVAQRAQDQSEDGTTVLHEAESAIYDLAESNIRRGFCGFKDILTRSFGSMDSFVSQGQRITGLETHYSDIDKETGGLQPSDLIILAARPSMGKTALASNIAENAAIKDGKVVAIFSLEMSGRSLLQRFACSVARVDSHKMRQGWLSKDDKQRLAGAVAMLADAPIFVDDTPGISLTELRAKARRLKHAKERIDLIVVDYMQLMTVGTKTENRTQEISAISRGLKGIAKELEVPVLALSQLNRATETRTEKRPQLSDLRESGAIEQDADLVAFIFREEVYDPKNLDLAGKAEFIIAKQRNGPTGTVDLTFLRECTRFESFTRERA